MFEVVLLREMRSGKKMASFETYLSLLHMKKTFYKDHK